MNKVNKKYIIETIMFLTYVMFAVNWIAGTTLTPSIMKYFNLTSFSSATFISNAITAAKIIGNLCAAILLVKLNPKKAIAFASFLIVFGSIFAVVVPSYAMFILGRFIMGFGGALFVVYFSPIVIHYFDPEKRIVINGLNGSAYNIGSIVAMIIVAPVIGWLITWQNSMLFFAGLSGLLLIMWLLFGEDFELKNSSTTNKVEKYPFSQALKEKFNYVFPFTYSGLLSLYIVTLTIFPISGGASVDPKLLSAIMAFSGVVGAIVGIFYVKKFVKRITVIRFSGILMSIFALVMFTTTSSMIAIISAALMGFLMFLPITALVTIPQELENMSASKLTMIMGIFWSFSYILQTIAYYIIGVIIDKNGYQVGLLVAVAFSLTFFIGSFLLPETGKRKE